MFRTIHLSIIRSFSLYTQQWYMSANVYDIYHCCVYSKKTPDDGEKNRPKHVEFHSKNKFEKLVHLVGFNIQIFHDVRSHERQIYQDQFLYHLAFAQDSQEASSFEGFQLIFVYRFFISNVLSVKIIFIARPRRLGVKL